MRRIQGGGLCNDSILQVMDHTQEENISQYALIKDYGIDKAQLQRLRKNMVVKTVILNRLCSILDCKIEDIMEFVPDEDIK